MEGFVTVCSKNLADVVEIYRTPCKVMMVSILFEK